MANCLITGTLLYANGSPLVGANIYYVPAQSPAISSTGYALSPLPISTASTSSGYFSFSVLQGITIVVTIAAIGFREKISVPSTTTYDLFNTTSVQVASGDIPEPSTPDVNPAW